MIPCEIDLTSTPFLDTKIITYGIELPPSGKKFGFNLLDDEGFEICYVADTIPNSLAGHQLLTQAKRNMWIIYINGEEPITYKGAIDEINRYQTPRGKSKVNISICRRKSYQRIDIEDTRSIFDKVRPIVSHLEVNLPKETSIKNNISEGLKFSQRQWRKEDLFVKYDKNKNMSLLQDTTPIKPLPEGKTICSFIATIIKECDFYDA